MAKREAQINWTCSRNDAVEIVKIIGARELTVIYAEDATNGHTAFDCYDKMVQFNDLDARANAIAWINGTYHKYLQERGIHCEFRLHRY